MRYEKFILENYKTITLSKDVGEGLQSVPTGISEAESFKYLSECCQVECLYHALCELFEIHNMTMDTTGDAHSFFIINKTDGENEEGIKSVWLSREKLKEANPLELSGAMIDLILHRKTWTDKVSYSKLHLD